MWFQNQIKVYYTLIDLESWERESKCCGLITYEGSMNNLPPPPSLAIGIGNNRVQDCEIPLPPCAFQPPYYKTCSKKGLIWMQHHDPFFAAYKHCTNNDSTSDEYDHTSTLKHDSTSTKFYKPSKIIRKAFSILSCKRSSSVSHNSLVRISHSSQDITDWGLQGPFAIHLRESNGRMGKFVS